MFSKSVEYALKSLIIIDQSDENINSDMISTKLDIPKNFTSKILQILSKKDYISSKKGINGGFTRLNYEKTIKELIIDIDGKFTHDKCALGLGSCSDENACPLHNVYKPIKEEILNTLMNKRIKDVCKDPNKVLKI
jgi:Rrf2 family protein